MKKVCVIQGPNLNMLGRREPDLYGNSSLEQLHTALIRRGSELDLEVECFQSNQEGKLIDFLHKVAEDCVFLIINAAAYTHTSIALRDALLSVNIPAVEVHITNIYAREDFRHRSLLADIVQGQICGLGTYGYFLALEYIHHHLNKVGSA